MKKKYIAPALEIVHVQVTQMMALSLQTDKANGSDALVKGSGDWDIFGTEDAADSFSDSPFEE